MRVRLDRYEAANRSMLTRSTIFLVLGIVGFIVTAFGAFVGFAIIISPGDEPGDALWIRRSGFFLVIFFAVVPGVISALMLAYAFRQRARFRRLGELAAVARGQTAGWVTSEAVARGLGTTTQLAERLIIEATALGMLEDGPPPWASTPQPPQPHVVIPSSDHRASANMSAVARAPTVTPPGTNITLDVSEAPRFETGALIGGTYRIEERLGKGGMGEVFAARHQRTGRRYAIKTMLAGQNASEAVLRRFEREATAASALGHPGIVQVHDFNVAPGGTFYLVMDLLEGETLDERLTKRGALGWSEAQRIAIELCAALTAAHDHGLLHRDIKPSNVFLATTKGSRERAVLVDFGLVKQIEEGSSLLTSTGAVIGTPMYMSPEQARGEPLDVRTDEYSLAAVIFEMVTGAPPFQDRTLAGVYARLLKEPAPRASQVAKRPVPRAVDDILARALAKDREARFSDVRAFGEALAVVADDAPTTERMS